MSTLSNKSLLILKTCDVQLQAVVHKAAEYSNFTVICGHRTKADQDTAVARGNSKTPWPTSKHNSDPSQAVDLYPYSTKYGLLLDIDSIVDKILTMNNLATGSIPARNKAIAYIHQEFCRMAQSMLNVAQDLGIPIIWGADWDMDGDRLDHSFIDLPHFELKYPKVQQQVQQQVQS